MEDFKKVPVLTTSIIERLKETKFKEVKTRINKELTSGWGYEVKFSNTENIEPYYEYTFDTFSLLEISDLVLYFRNVFNLSRRSEKPDIEISDEVVKNVITCTSIRTNHTVNWYQLVEDILIIRLDSQNHKKLQSII